MGKEQELLDAARTGNLSAIEKLLTNKSRKSTVGVAIGQRLTNFLKSVNVNCTDKNGSSALHHAAVNGHRDVVEALLRAEAQPGLVDNQGCTPVHLAAWSGNPEIVLQLLTAGLDQEPGVACPVTPVHVNQQNNSGDTALHCASQYGHVAVVDVLLQKQANPTIRNLEEASPLDLAAQYGHLAVVQRLLISHPELAQRPSCTQSPLHLAAGNGHRDIVAVLLDNDFNIQTMTDTGTALHQAALHGKLDVVKLLLERGINVHIADKKGQTALMLLGMHQTQQKSFTEITQAIKEHIARTELTMPGVYETLASCKSGHGDKPIAAVKPIPPEKPEPLNINPPDKPFPAPRTSPPPLSPNKSAMSAPKQPTVPILLTHPPPTVPTVPSHPPPAVPEKGDNLARSESSSSVRSPTPPPLPPRQSYFVKDEKPASQPIVPSSPDTLTEKSSPSSVTKLAPQKPKKPPRQKKSPAPGRHSPPNIKDNPLESPTQPSRPIVPDSIPNKDSIPSVVNSDSSSTLQHSNSDFNQSQGGDSKTDQSQNLLHSNEAKSPVSPKPELPPKKVHSSVDNSVDPLTGSKKPNYLDFIKRSSSTPLTPTGYPQPPTPDFPPPSPATAMLGIELKIQEMDSKRRSRDMTTLTDETLDSIQELGQRSDIECVESQSFHTSKPVTTIEEDIEEETNSKQEGNNSLESNVDLSKGTPDTKVIASNSGLTGEKNKAADVKNDKKLTSASNVNNTKERKKSVIEEGKNKGSPKSSASGNAVIPIKPKIMPRTQQNGSKTEQKQTEKESATQSESSDTKVDSPGGESPVMMRKKSSSSNPDMDLFKGLFRGSIVGGPRKVVSQFYDDVPGKPAAAPRNSDLLSYVTFDTVMEKDEDIDVDQVMKSIDVEVARRSATADSMTFDDAEEWEKIQDTLASFGAAIARESVFIRDIEPAFTKLLAGTNQLMSVGEWLQGIGMGQYENTFISNGFDNLDFLGEKILEEQDLEQIGVLAHDHRQQILQAARSLPQIKPIDPSSLPGSVEVWLQSLQLTEYLETFTSHGYDTMEKVQSINWELQLRTVLNISILGHRKRILASLGERQIDKNQSKRSISSLSPEETRSRFSNLDFEKDYRHIKPAYSSEEDIKDSHMQVDSSEEEEVFSRKTGQLIRNSNIHVRPPHLANTNSPAKQWRHKPEMLIKGCCNYTAQYLGSTVVPELTGGTQSTRAGITKLKKSTDVLAKIPVIMLSISYKGVRFIDAKTKKVICDHEIGNIFCACQDTENLNFFAYITRDIETGHHYCHVFSVKSSSLAHDIILTLGESFEVAYQMALKEKSDKEAMELDRKMSQSESADDTYSVISKTSTNTV